MQEQNAQLLKQFVGANFFMSVVHNKKILLDQCLKQYLYHLGCSFALSSFLRHFTEKVETVAVRNDTTLNTETLICLPQPPLPRPKTPKRCRCLINSPTIKPVESYPVPFTERSRDLFSGIVMPTISFFYVDVLQTLIFLFM